MKKSLFQVIRVLVIIFLAFFLFPSFCLAQSPTFLVQSSKNTFQANEAFITQVFINAYGAEVNTVSLNIGYSTEFLFLEDISFTESVFPSVIERSVESGGLIDLTCFSIVPYKGNNGLVVSLKFRTKKDGAAVVEILSSSKIHAADGMGTNIFGYQPSVNKDYFIIGSDGGLGEEGIGAELPHLSYETTPTKAEETGAFEVIKGFFSKPIDFIKKILKEEPETVHEDEEKEKLLFPEQNVVDYSRARQTKFKRFLNKLKTGSKQPELNIFIVAFSLLGLGLATGAGVFIVRKIREKKRKNES